MIPSASWVVFHYPGLSVSRHSIYMNNNNNNNNNSFYQRVIILCLSYRIVGISANTVLLFLCNKDQQDAIFLKIYFSNHPLHVSNRVTVHHREVVYTVCSLWYLSCWKYIMMCKITYTHTRGHSKYKTLYCMQSFTLRWCLLHKCIMLHGPQNVRHCTSVQWYLG